MFSLGSQLCSSLSNSKAGYLDFHMLTDLLVHYHVLLFQPRGEFMHSSQFSVTVGQAVTGLVCWSVLCLDCLHFYRPVGKVLKNARR